MPEPQDIESILSRLAAPAISSRGIANMHQMLDGLSAQHATVRQPIETLQAPQPSIQAAPSVSRSKVLAAIAAAVVLAVSGIWPETTIPSPAMQRVACETNEQPALWLVSESDRLESVSDDDRTAELDGSVMQAIHMELLEENQWFDEETGIVMNVFAPREEIFLMPISAF